MSKYTQEPWPDNVPLAGPDRPANDRSIDYLIKYLMTVRKRFGNTTVTCDLHWGASALHKLSDHAALLAAKDEEIAELKKELHNWRGKASWTGDARDHANDEAPKESTNA